MNQKEKQDSIFKRNCAHWIAFGVTRNHNEDFSFLSKRENELVRDVFSENKTLEEMGQKYDLTRERVRQILNRAVRRLANNCYISIKYQESYQKSLAEANEKIQELAIKLKYCEENKLPKIEGKNVFLVKDIRDSNLSVRALNCLKAADLETFGDVYKLTKKQVFGFRNFGKKSLSEIEKEFEMNGIKWPTN